MINAFDNLTGISFASLRILPATSSRICSSSNRDVKKRPEPTSFSEPGGQDRKRSPSAWQESSSAARRSFSRLEAQFHRRWVHVCFFIVKMILSLPFFVGYHTESMVFNRARSRSFVMSGSPRSLAVATMILSWSSVTSFVSTICERTRWSREMIA